MATRRAVALISGGLDSAVAATTLVRDGFEVAALHSTYGQRTEERELQAFNDVCDDLQIDLRLVVDLRHLAAIGGSSLTDRNMAVPMADLSSTEIPNSYVPFRNGNLLSIAASWAEVLEADTICIGAVEEDSSGYPDCRRPFFDSMQETIRLGTKPAFNPQILTPLIDLRKSDIVRRGVDLDAPLAKTWSCYKSSDVPCGECESCALRARGFSEAGMTDPVLL